MRIVNYVAAHDVGRALNPMLLKGQIAGGGMMGLGYALCENMVYKDGRSINPNYLDYKMLTARDLPPMEAVIIETDEPEGPFGAKGIGEPGLGADGPGHSERHLRRDRGEDKGPAHHA